ncbi:complex 1 [Fusarium longipes]|uniref:Complex 1 n=1 Tax=Fusarium longipes TaxID=694270 RepID=A0A395RQ58_9HYPO|nr:complex 1 [Fusarium longipes]
MMASTTQISHAYRTLYRNLLKAVQYSSPSRFVARDQLRRAFREPGATYDERGIKRTNWFLEAAAREKGMEHKILKNLLRVQQMRFRKKRYSAYDPLKYAKHEMRVANATAYNHYDMTVAMLNKSMGTLLR